MGQSQWEQHREMASQMIGNKASAMWDTMVAPKFSGGQHHVRDVAKIHTPHLAAKMVEAEHAHRGEHGGFHAALKHVRNALSSLPGGRGDSIVQQLNTSLDQRRDATRAAQLGPVT